MVSLSPTAGALALLGVLVVGTHLPLRLALPVILGALVVTMVVCLAALALGRLDRWRAVRVSRAYYAALARAADPLHVQATRIDPASPARRTGRVAVSRAHWGRAGGIDLGTPAPTRIGG